MTSGECWVPVLCWEYRVLYCAVWWQLLLLPGRAQRCQSHDTPHTDTITPYSLIDTAATLWIPVSDSGQHSSAPGHLIRDADCRRTNSQWPNSGGQAQPRGPGPRQGGLQSHHGGDHRTQEETFRLWVNKSCIRLLTELYQNCPVCRPAPVYKRAQRLHPHPGQPADRENPQPQLGGGLQKLNNDTSPHVLRQWGEDTSNCVDKQSMIISSCFQRFTQYLASSNSNFQLANFLDKTGVQGG